MCDNRDGKFVVPTLPAAGKGWWIGQLMVDYGFVTGPFGDRKHLRQVNVLRVQNPEYCGDPVILVTDIEEFDDIDEAMSHLATKGVNF